MNLTKEDIVESVSEIVSKSIAAVEKKMTENFDAKLAAKDAEAKAAAETAAKAIADAAAATKAKGEFEVTDTGTTQDAKKKGYDTTIKFINGLISKDSAAIKELGLKIMSSSVGSNGGYLVPTEFGTKIEEIRKNVGLARKLARYVPMNTARKLMPILANDVVVYFPEEGGLKLPSDFSLGQVELNAKFLAGIAIVTNELIADSDYRMIDFFAERFAQAIAQREDQEMLVGTGVPFVGVMNEVGVTIVQMTSGNVSHTQVTLDDLQRVKFSLPELVVNNAVWVANKNILLQIQLIKEDGRSIITTCNPVTAVDYRGGLLTPAGMLLGYPFYTNPTMPATATAGQDFLVFGDFNYVYFAEREGIVMATSTEATIGGISLWERNLMGLRVEERIAIAVALPEAFTKLRTANS
jgi:HK97 family phage major capsid protein